jgi:hypothetical protein
LAREKKKEKRKTAAAAAEGKNERDLNTDYHLRLPCMQTLT